MIPLSIPIIIATLAPLINCIQLLPQLWRTYKTKRVNDLSGSSLMLILFTNLLWFLHGFYIMDLPLLASGGISIVINLSLFTLYMIYK